MDDFRILNVSLLSFLYLVSTRWSAFTVRERQDVSQEGACLCECIEEKGPVQTCRRDLVLTCSAFLFEELRSEERIHSSELYVSRTLSACYVIMGTG